MVEGSELRTILKSIPVEYLDLSSRMIEIICRNKYHYISLWRSQMISRAANDSLIYI
jgi:hypothetical protein